MSTSSPLDRVLALALGALLAVALIVGLAPNTSTRLVGLGEAAWPGYASELRQDPVAPTCAVDELKQRADTCVEPTAAPNPTPVDPFAEPSKPAPVDPFAEPSKPVPVDPFAEPSKPVPVDPFAEPSKPTVSCAAVRALAERCEQRWSTYDEQNARVTSGVRTFRSLDRAVGAFVDWPFHKHTLVLLVLLGGLATSWNRAHLALRTPTSKADVRLAEGAQVVAHLAWMASCLADWRVQTSSTAEIENGALPLLWAGGFLVLAGVHGFHAVRATGASDDGGLPHPLVIPLYTWMGLLATVWFALEGHPSGQAIFLHKFVQIPSIYVGIALYIWAGMLLARTSLASRVFDVLLPWKLPPAVLGWLVVVLAALPTAYSGASGIFVIAAGAVIFERLTAAGANPRMALAATAMSGSLGVVLRPCLVVVLIAVLNKNVTTDALFGWGLVVFGLTAVLFLVAVLLRNDRPFERPVVGEALSGSGTALRGLLPFGILGGLGILGYRFVLGTEVTEHTAAWVLPGLLLLLALWDRVVVRVDGPPFVPALQDATAEAAHHTGALLFVMLGSVGVGGVVERSELLERLPTDFGSPAVAMAFLVVVMVLVGMTMDALGAVILVSVSLAGVADANGIDPVHFWMMVLVAFELGYLTPPVALNHLLARQVIGEAADVSDLPASSFFERHEHILLPMGVMATALVLVAFVPLLVTTSG